MQDAVQLKPHQTVVIHTRRYLREDPLGQNILGQNFPTLGGAFHHQYQIVATARLAEADFGFRSLAKGKDGLIRTRKIIKARHQINTKGPLDRRKLWQAACVGCVAHVSGLGDVQTQHRALKGRIFGPLGLANQFDGPRDIDRHGPLRFDKAISVAGDPHHAAIGYASRPKRLLTFDKGIGGAQAPMLPALKDHKDQVRGVFILGQQDVVLTRSITNIDKALPRRGNPEIVKPCKDLKLEGTVDVFDIAVGQ